MTLPSLRHQIQTALHHFGQGSLKANALHLWDTLGYRSDKQLDLEPNTAATFRAEFATGLDQVTFNPQNALVDDWQSVDFLFQLAGEDLAIGGQLPLISQTQVDTSEAAWQSYLLFAIRLQDRPYTRTELAKITREVNKLFPMPVMLTFQHGHTLTLSVINRRLNQRYPERDVLEKVTLIKDIQVTQPHRAHIEILADLASDELHRVHGFTSFETLHRAWQTTLDSSELNKRFFQEVADWYFWAIPHVQFPTHGQPSQNPNEINLIRLITRLIFVWFLKEKGLVSDDLFNLHKLRDWLKTLQDGDSSYYRAILQNLFFATLNQEMDKRQFRNRSQTGSRDQNYMITNLYRYEDAFAQVEPVLTRLAQVPFLNGGLFECLDRRVEQANGQTIDLRIDGFSDNPRYAAVVPNELFFTAEREPDVDLNAIYGSKKRSYRVRGLIEIFHSYKFTVTENTPIEEEIALDPELLGKVFENLLAAYNPETQTTARKQTGSFYTPREIVNYMVDESLIAYLEQALNPQPPAADSDSRLPAGEGLGVRDKLRQLVDYSSIGNPFADTPEVTVLLIAAIDRLKILDPAVGSGAFPMGMLQKLVLVLGKLDPDNALWKHEQKERAIRPVLADIQQAQQISYDQAREAAITQLQERLQAIEADFANDDMDYPRKLFLIENCIYGVDIQPVAVQIAKLRCFISLVVEQTPNESQPNRGIKALPNLETQFVTANTLLAIQDQLSLRSQEVIDKEAELQHVRRSLFTAKTQATKHKYRDRDKHLRHEISTLLKATGLSPATADTLAYWDPYDQNASAPFFDPHWMFGLEEGFDIVIGNPPYVRHEKLGSAYKVTLKQNFSTIYSGTADLYTYFYGCAIKLLKEQGWLAFITSNKWFKANYGKPLRKFIANTCHIQNIIDFGELAIFEAATFPMIFLAQKGKSQTSLTHFTQVTSLNPPYPNIQALIQEQGILLPKSALACEDWQFTNSDIAKCLDKMRGSGVILEEYVSGKIFYGVKTGFNKAFVIDEKTKEELINNDHRSADIIKPLAVGDDIRKWYVRHKRRWLIFIPWHFPSHEDTSIKGASIRAEKLFKEQYVAIYDYLLQFKVELSSRNVSETGIRYEWYALQRCASTYWEEFGKPKIIYPVIAKEPRFAFDLDGTITNDKGFIIPINDLYLLGILNSSFVWFFLKNICSVLGNADRGGRLELRSIYVSQIPIPPATDADRAAITTLVQHCLDAQGQNVAHWEAEIDDRIAHLYGLTPDDLKIIQNPK